MHEYGCSYFAQSNNVFLGEKMKCLICENETENYICSDCRFKLREEYPEYSEYKAKLISFADSFEKTRRNFVIACLLTNNGAGVFKADREWLYESFNKNKISEYDNFDRLKIYGWLLDASYQDYEYETAEEYATILLQEKNIPYSAAIALTDYLTKTRRYDSASSIVEYASTLCAGDPARMAAVEKLRNNNADRYEKSLSGKGEFMPNPKESRDAVRKKYVDFLSTLGIDASIPRSVPKPIPKDDYLKLKCISDPDFTSYVAFDFETTGLSTSHDSIIEVGAVKVINGKVSESKAFLFDEFVKPYKSRVTDVVTKTTGIKPEDVASAREMWEVIPDFLKFVGDLPLVGYNSSSFDNAFLERAGRYSGIIIKNDTFDVLTYARKKKNCLPCGQKFSLESLSTSLGIKNPAAHRAYADAITTAKVFEKIRTLSN